MVMVALGHQEQEEEEEEIIEVKNNGLLW